VVCRKHGQIVNDSPFFSALMAGVESECHRLGYSTIISIWTGVPWTLTINSREILHDRTAANLILATEFAESDARLFAGISHPAGSAGLLAGIDGL